MYDFDTVIDRRNSGCVKWDTGKRIYNGGDDFIAMWIADTDFATLPEITQAIAKRIAHPLFGYCTEPKAFFESIQNWFLKRHGWQIDREWISQAEGVVNAIALAINAFTKPGDKIVVQTPCYDNFSKAIQNNGRVIAPNPMKREGNKYLIDLEDLEAAFKGGAKVLLFCNPHNPTGRVFSRGELEAVASLCVKYDVLVISDDIHCDVVRPEFCYTPIASVNPDMLSRTLTCVAPGKTFNIASLKASAVVIPDKKLMDGFKAWQQRMFLPKLGVLGYEACVAAYTFGAEYVDALNEYIKGNADYTIRFLKENAPQIVPIPNEGTFLMSWDCSSLGLSGWDLVMFFAREAGVGFSAGISYSPSWGSFVRVNLACSREVLAGALTRVAAAVNANFA